MENKKDFIRIETIRQSPAIEAMCITCNKGMKLHRCSQFPICDDCINDLREIIAERRKPKVVEIGPRILGGENV